MVEALIVVVVVVVVGTVEVVAAAAAATAVVKFLMKLTLSGVRPSTDQLFSNVGRLYKSSANPYYSII